MNNSMLMNQWRWTSHTIFLKGKKAKKSISRTHMDMIIVSLGHAWHAINSLIIVIDGNSWHKVEFWLLCGGNWKNFNPKTFSNWGEGGKKHPKLGHKQEMLKDNLKDFKENKLPNVMLSELISSAKNRVSQLEIKSRDIFDCFSPRFHRPPEFKPLHFVQCARQHRLIHRNETQL